MPTKVEICNLALDRLGATPITSLTDNSKAARLCSSNFDLMRDGVLRDYPWEFASKRANLALDSTEPEFEFQYRHALPTDFIRLISIYDWPEGTPWALEGEYILSNSDTVYIKYTHRITDVSKFSPDFAISLSLRLASSICFSLTGDKALQNQVRGEYVNTVQMAKFVGSFESEPVEFMAESWLNARA